MHRLTKIYAYPGGICKACYRICFCKHNYPYKYFINGFVNNDLIHGKVMDITYLFMIIFFQVILIWNKKVR